MGTRYRTPCKVLLSGGSTAALAQIFYIKKKLHTFPLKICPIMTTLDRRVGHRRARLIAPASLLPDTSLCHLFSLANSKWLYRHLSVARASSVRRQGAPRAGEDGNFGG
ncbi:jg27660 [Pararge aegeria aegeria]|uniref:Jg27660 protein n=1 Tax=Pararge aegeria aegeria TaxID=348720 RepID=A0A8S4RKZ0_9NEOP|nr:jg27660 [Pararge aegeria aegeria]